LSGALRGEPTEQPQGWRGDVVAGSENHTCAGRLAPMLYDDSEGSPPSVVIMPTLTTTEH
jgi:hypothetical protein